jgi:hypothetical protein
MVYVSLVLGVLSVLTIPVIALLRLTQGPQFFGGQATTIVLLLMLSSFQLFFLFVMGQYVARIYDEVRGRPLYVVASTAGLLDEDQEARQKTPRRLVSMPDGTETERSDVVEAREQAIPKARAAGESSKQSR